MLPALATLDTFRNQILHTDAMTLLRSLPPASVDLVLTDPPYGITACEWDVVPPLVPLWEQIKRVIKPNAAVVMTASQPFTTDLINSNRAMFRYEWIWQKTLATDFLNANRKPLKAHENVLIFYAMQPIYNPVMSAGKAYRATSGAAGGFVRDKTVGGYETVNLGFRYPHTVIRQANETGLHPTQKPVALFSYLIRTYTHMGAVVVDPFMGSGTTAIAARSVGRDFIGCDTSAEYVALARNRLAQGVQLDMFPEGVA